MNKHDEFMELFNQDFSQEITDEEAILFLASCPMGQTIAQLLISGYLMSRIIVDSPYKALQISLKAFMDTIEQVKK